MTPSLKRKKEMANNSAVKELLNRTFYSGLINQQLCLCTCLWTISLLELSTFHSNERTALKTIIERRRRRREKMRSAVLLSPPRSLAINLLTHDYVSHTFVFPLVETCTSTWAPHSKLQSTRLSLCDSRDSRWPRGSFMHSLNSLRWKSEIAANIHSPQERSTNVWPSPALSHFLWSLWFYR